MSDHSKDRIVTIYSSFDLLTAEMVANSLKGEGITCHVVNGNQSAHPGLGVVPVEIIVREEDADRALAYIKKTES